MGHDELRASAPRSDRPGGKRISGGRFVGARVGDDAEDSQVSDQREGLSPEQSGAKGGRNFLESRSRANTEEISSGRDPEQEQGKTCGVEGRARSFLQR